jgi:hypothetical protein
VRLKNFHVKAAYFTGTNSNMKWHQDFLNFPENIVNVKLGKFPLSELEKCSVNLGKNVHLSERKTD